MEDLQPVPDLSEEIGSRFQGAPWAEAVHNLDVLIIGAGGIGSWAALNISRLNPRHMTIVDPDVVDASNLSGQLYRTGDIGSRKARVTAGICNDFSNCYNVNFFNRPLEPHDVLNRQDGYDIIISAVDNMATRQQIFNLWKEDLSNHHPLLIDARMAAEVFQVFCLSPNTTKDNNEWLFSDSEADATVCSFKQTSFVASILGGFITNLVVNYTYNTVNPIVERPVPFYSQYKADLLMLE